MGVIGETAHRNHCPVVKHYIRYVEPDPLELIHSALEVGVEHDQFSFIVADESHPMYGKMSGASYTQYGRIVVDSESIINHSYTFSSHAKVGSRNTKNQTLNQISTPCR